MKKILLVFLFFSGFLKFLISQNDTTDLLSLLSETPPKEYTIATFKTTRLVNFHTVEVLGKRCLDFRISHRFGDVNSGIYNAFGIDGGANIRLALEYSPDARFMMGIGRTSSQKIVDGFLKYKLLRQTPDNQMPFTLTLFSGMYYSAEKKVLGGVTFYSNETDRFSFCNQLMIGRKFNSSLSLQITMGMVHVNLAERITDKNDCYFTGVVARMKLSKRQAVTVEYAQRLNKYSQTKYYNSLAVGYDIETGGHVFQMHFTNSFGLTENQFYMYTPTTWSNWGIRLGFNVSRVFAL